MTTVDNPTFEEGPFYLLEATTHPYTGRRAIIWAIDEHAARWVFSSKLNWSLAYHVLTLLGNLEDLKETVSLKPDQLEELHREGYVRL